MPDQPPPPQHHQERQERQQEQQLQRQQEQQQGQPAAGYDDSVSHALTVVDMEAAPELSPLFTNVVPGESGMGTTEPPTLCLLGKVCRILTTTVAHFLALLFPFGLSVSMIVMGTLYLHECPAREYLPIYLLTMGTLGTARLGVFCWRRALVKCCVSPATRWGEVFESLVLTRIALCFEVALVLLLLIESIIVFSVYSDVSTQDPAVPSYCHHILYYYTLWTMVVLCTLLCVGPIVGVIGYNLCCVFPGLAGNAEGGATYVEA